VFGITWVEIDAEADDVSATLAASCPTRDVVISSVDLTHYQLLRDAGPGHGSADYRALAGNTSDNIPGSVASAPKRQPSSWTASPSMTCPPRGGWPTGRSRPPALRAGRARIGFSASPSAGRFAL
jgi:hypothetical protein